MDKGMYARTSPGGRPPPSRTYGSKNGSKRAGRRNDQQQQVPNSCLLGGTRPVSGGNSRSSSSALALQEQPGLPLYKSRLGCAGDAHIMSSRSAARFGGGGGGGGGGGLCCSTADEIALLVRSAGAGGDEGRAAAIALAQACKSRETRKAMRENGGNSVLDELLGVMQTSPRDGGGHRRYRDEAIVHCLAVALFILSKDRALAKGFSASVVSTLAALVESTRQVDDEKEPGDAGLLQSSLATEIYSKGKSTSRKTTAVLGKRQRRSGASSCSSNPAGRRTARQARGGRATGSVFDMSDEGEEDTLDGVAAAATAGAGGGVAGDDGVDASDDNADTVSPFSRSRAKEQGSASVMVRARMLLDITDVLPWGLANRHLVSVADLALATLLNVAAQACPDGGQKGVTEGGDGPGDSLDEEFSTQSSATLSQSDPSSALTDELSDVAKTAANAGVMPELSRLGPSGFLLPLVVDGAGVLEDLSVSRTGSGTGAAVDPSSLRLVHQLLLTLRLLDLATLESSSEGDTSTNEGGANAARPALSADLCRALLRVVSRCLRINGKRGASGQRKGSSASTDATAARGRLEVGVRHQQPRKQQPFVDEVAARVHECLLAALRVLINVTHNDAAVCAEVAAGDGLKTLMVCLVAHSSDIKSREGNDDDSSPFARLGRAGSDALLGEVANGGERTVEPGASLGDGNNGGAGRRGNGGVDFDAQVLAMGALINCVELKESADNCAAMASLVVRPPATPSKRAGVGGQLSASELSPKCFAPEFLARLLVHCTRSFAQQLEVGRTDEEEQDSASSPPKGREGDGKDANSTEPAVAPPARPVKAAANPGGEEEEEEDEDDEMSHAEGADLVLGGHCALLLGLLVREDETNRRLTLSALPDRTATLIVRVLEAFMALQYQAGVLTEEVVLKVQLLVEDLDGMDGLPEKEWDPFKLDSEDDEPTPSAPTPSPFPRKVVKNNLSPARKPVARTFSTPPSGQWATDAEGSDHADGFSLATTRPSGRLPSWLPQAAENESSRTLDGRVASGKPRPSSPTTTPSSEARSAARRPQESSDVVDTPSRGSRVPGQSRSGWRVGSAAGGRLGVGRGAGDATGIRSWLGGSQPRKLGKHNTYGRKSWNKPARSLTGFRSPLYGKLGPPAGRRGEARDAGSDKDVFDMLSDTSEDAGQGPKPGSRSGSDGEMGGVSGKGGVASKSGRSSTTASSKSVFDLDCLSDDSPVKLSSQAGRAPAVKAALTSVGGGGGSGSGASAEFPTQTRPNGRQQRDPSPPPPAKAGGITSSARGFGPRSGGAAGRRPVTQQAAPENIARRVIPKPKSGAVAAQACDWTVGSRPRPPFGALARQGARGAGQVPSVAGRVGARGGAEVSQQTTAAGRASVFEIGKSDSDHAEASPREAGGHDRSVFDFEDESD